jgi:hypothetical protein
MDGHIIIYRYDATNRTFRVFMLTFFFPFNWDLGTGRWMEAPSTRRQTTNTTSPTMRSFKKQNVLKTKQVTRRDRRASSINPCKKPFLPRITPRTGALLIGWVGPAMTPLTMMTYSSTVPLRPRRTSSSWTLGVEWALLRNDIQLLVLHTDTASDTI